MKPQKLQKQIRKLEERIQKKKERQLRDYSPDVDGEIAELEEQLRSIRRG